MSTSQIDKGLERYYHHKGISYKEDDESYGMFAEWCDINGYDTDGIKDELQQDPEDCALIDFDEEFPTSKEVFNIIKYCIEDEDAFIDSVEILHKIHDHDKNRKIKKLIKICKIWENNTLSDIMSDILPFKYTPQQITSAVNFVFNAAYNKNDNMDTKIPHNPEDIDSIFEYLSNYGKPLSKNIPSSDFDPPIIRKKEIFLTPICFLSIFDKLDLKSHLLRNIFNSSLQVTVYNDAEIYKNTNIKCKGDIIFNIGGNFIINAETSINSESGNIILNVGGEIKINEGCSRIIGKNIYIRCSKLDSIGGWKQAIQTTLNRKIDVNDKAKFIWQCLH